MFDECVVLKKPISVKLRDSRTLVSTKVARITTFFQVYGRKSEITLFNVFYVKDMKQNLVSYSKVTVKNKVISYGNTSKVYNQNRELIAIAKKR